MAYSIKNSVIINNSRGLVGVATITGDKYVVNNELGFASGPVITGISTDATLGVSTSLLVTQSAVKGYVDSQLGDNNQLMFEGDFGVAGQIELKDEKLYFVGEDNQIDTTVGPGINTITFTLSNSLQLPGTLAFGANGQVVGGINTESDLAGASDGQLVSALAAKSYADSLISGGGADLIVNSLQSNTTIGAAGTISGAEVAAGLGTFTNLYTRSLGISTDGLGQIISGIKTEILVGAANTELVTAKGIKEYVDTQISETGGTLNFAAGVGTGSVDLSSQSLSIVGTGLEVETSAADQTLTIGLPDSVTITDALTVTGDINANGNIVGDNSTNLTGIADAEIGGSLEVSGNLDATGYGISATNGVWAEGNLHIDGNVELGQVGSSVDLQLDGGGAGVSAIEIESGAGTLIKFGKNIEAAGSFQFGPTGQAVDAIGISSDLGNTSASDTVLPSQKAVKDYVDGQIAETGGLLNFGGDDSSTGSVDLSTQSLNIVGTNLQVETNAVDQTLTIGLPDTVVVAGDAAAGGLVVTSGVSTFGGALFAQAPVGLGLSVASDARINGVLDVDGNLGGTGYGVTVANGIYLGGNLEAVGNIGGADVNASGAIVAQGNITGAALAGDSIQIAGGEIIDQFDTDATLSADADTRVATQAAVKAYVDNSIAESGSSLNFAAGVGTGNVDLSSEVLTFTGVGLEIETSAANQEITIGLPDAVTIDTLTVTNNITANGNIVGDNSTDISGINNVTATEFIGGGSGILGVSTANSANRVQLTQDDNTTGTLPIIFAANGTGNTEALFTDTTDLNYNPGNANGGTLNARNINNLSDARYKENVKDIENGLEKINAIRGVTYDWRDGRGGSVGLIAQELHAVLPEAVDTSNEERYSVNYNGAIALLIQAVKELSAEVEELKKAQ